MVLTLEDHERRIAALEVAQSTAGDGLTRLDRKVDRLTARVDALHHVTAELIAESEQRQAARVDALRQATVELIAGSEQRLTDRIGTTERRFTDLLNERFDAMMVALDRFTNPPKD
jgi:hypothetical protein